MAMTKRQNMDMVTDIETMPMGIMMMEIRV